VPVTCVKAVPAALDINTPLPVKLDTPVPPCVTAKSLASVTVPDTSISPLRSMLALTSTSLVAESSTNLPDVVVIVWSSAIPTVILPRSAPVP
jgi:hypothetical protein